MINLEFNQYRNLVKIIITANDFNLLVKEFEDDRIFLYSILKDIHDWKKSPNYKILKKIARENKVSEDFIVEQAFSIIKYLKPKEHGVNYYNILKTNPNASQDIIRGKWIELVKENHPDRVGSAGLEKTKIINKAYDILSDSEKRREFDNSLISAEPVLVRDILVSPINFKLKYSLPVIAIVLLISYFVISSFFQDNEEELKIARLYESSKTNNKKQNFIKPGISNQKDINVNQDIAKYEDYEDISKERIDKLNKYLQDRKAANIQADSIDQVITESKFSDVLREKNDILTHELAKNISKDDLYINQLKSPQLNEEITKIETKNINGKNVREDVRDVAILEPVENQEAIVAKSQTLDPSSPNTDLLKSEIPKPESLIAKTSSPNIESRTSNPEIYTVKSGDNLWKIARKNDTHVKDIIKLNKLKGNKLKLGQKLIIPVSGANSQVPKPLIAKTSFLTPDTQSLAPNTSSLASNPSSPNIKSRTSNPEIHTVKRGENLWMIAKKYDIRVKNITTANNLRNNKIKIGQKLIIPSSTDTSPEPESLIAKSPNTSTLAPNLSLPKIRNPKSRKSNPETRIPDSKSVYSFVSQYVSAYKMGDISRIKGMFSKNATENGISITKALVSYNDIFNNKKIIKYNILIDTINIKSEKSYVDGDFIITFKNLDEGNTKTSKGSINWVLDWKNDSWKIDQLNYQLKDTIFTDESL